MPNQVINFHKNLITNYLDIKFIDSIKITKINVLGMV
jgi:hypothetical protein